MKIKHIYSLGCLLPVAALANVGIDVMVKNNCVNPIEVTAKETHLKKVIAQDSEVSLGQLATSSYDSPPLNEEITVKESGDSIVNIIGKISLTLTPGLWTNTMYVAPLQGALTMSVYDWWTENLNETSTWWNRPSGTPKVRINVC